MENQIINVNQLIPSKQSLEGIVNNMTLSVLDNEESAIKQVASLDFIAKACTQAKEILKPFVFDELQKDPTNKDYHGYKIELAEVGASYDFTNCNDTELEELLNEQIILEKKISDRKAFLKTIKDHLDVIQDGEAKVIYPPVKKSTSSFKMTLK